MSITINFLRRKNTKEQVWKALNLVVALATLLNISGAAIWLQPPVAKAAAAANQSADLDQCANDPLPSPHTNGCATSETEWVNGNLGASKSVYLEGDSVPYRMRFDNLSLASHTVVIEWDTTKGGKHALDFLTTYNRTVADANPCLGVTGCGASSTFPIPVDPQVSGAGVTQIPGNFTLYGGTITGVSAYSYPDGAGFVGDKSAQIAITFTALTANPVLAWGGHISDRHDWGADNSAISVPGSPYHMRLIDLDGAGGNQDRSLSADAVIFPGSVTVIKQATPESSQSFGFTASPSPLSNFSLVDDGTSANTKVFSDIIDFKTYTVVETLPSGWTLNSIQCVDVTGGTSTNVGTRTASIGLAEGDNVTCTYSNERQAATITVIKNVINDNGGTKVAGDFTINATGGSPSPSSFPGSTTGTVVTVNPGAYSITETPPAGYAVSYSADCSGTVAAGQNKTCTVTNNDIAPKLTVTKVVINDNGGTKVVADFPLFVNATGVTSGVQNSFNAGTYTVSETNQAGYTAVISGDCAANGSITLAIGDVKSCTITNNDQASVLIVKKIVINDNGGNAVAENFSFKVNNGNSVVFEADSQNDLAVNAGTYSIVENAAAGYTTTYDNCSNVQIPNGGSTTCTITNNDIAPTITLNKVVINNNGGNATPNDFGLTIGGTSVTSGQVLAVNANTPIALNEAGLTGYTFVSITGDAKCPAVLNGTVTLNEGENVTCTITNDDVAPTITLNKVVINNNGGNATPNDFGLTIGGTGVTSGQILSVNANTPIALNEAGLTGYTFVSITGDAKCPAVLGGTSTLNEGENITCTITNDDVAPSITLNKVVTNNNGGTAGVNDFGLTIGGTPVTSGQTLAVNSNTPIALNEAGLFGYSFVSLTGDAKCPAVLNGTVTLNEGENVTCTITNDDVAPQLMVYKIVINNDGGTAVSSDFTLNVSATNPTPSQFAGSATGTLVTLNQGVYEVTEDYFPGYSPAFSTDCVGTIAVGETKSCFVTNTDDTPHLMVIKHVINDDGGSNIAGDFTMSVSGTDVSDSSFPGDETGTTVSLDAGAYNVTESGPSGYADSYSADCTGSIALGQTKICTITNNDIAPELTVIKHVINDNGGNNVAADFTMQVNGTNVSDSEFPGSETGTTVTVNAGAYSVGEIGLSGYVGTFSADCSGTIAVGEKKTCTVTNDDETASITLSKFVFNNNGGTAGVNDFGLTIGATAVDSGDTLNVMANTPIALNEAGLFGYDFVSLTGDAKCPAVLGGTVTLNEGEHVSCTITNNDIAPELTVIKHVVNDNGGNNVAGDFTMQVTGTNVSDEEFAGNEAGTTVTLNQGAYSVDEAAFSGYAKSIGQNCVGSISVGEKKTCTITNNDIAPTITLNKVVITDNGGTAGVNDFGLTIGATAVDSGDTLNVMANTPIALNEAGLFGYSFVSLTGDAKCPAVLNGTVTLDEGENVTCTITNDDVQPKLTVTKVVINDNGGNAVVADFPLWVDATSVVSGVQNGFNADDYLVSETSDANYTSAITGDCDTQGNVSLAVGDVKECTITNNDIAASLNVVKDGPATVQAGQQITYTINWEVVGPGFAANAMLVDTLPSNVTFDSASNNSATPVYDNNTGTVTWDLGTIGASSGSETITVNTADPEYNGTLVHNDVTFSSDDDEDSDDHDTVIESTFEVTIDKTAPATVESGAQMTYTLNWTVGGNSPIDNLVITDELPANTTFVSASNGGTELNGTVTWNLGAQNADANGSVTLTVAVANLLLDGTIITNTGEVCAESIPPQEREGTLKCDDDTTTTEVNSDFTVNIVKTDNIDPVLAGGQVTYTLAWTTSGNAPINNLVITDPVPAYLTFVSASNGGTLNAGVVTWNLGPKTPGDFGSVTVTMRAASPIANGTVVTNIATVCGTMLTSVQQTVQHCDDDDETTTITSTPSISITKTNNVAGFTNPGKTVTYTVVVTNAANATDTANAVIMTDVLPAGFTFADTGLGTKSFNLGNIAPGASVTTTYLVNISANQLAGIYTNTASAQGSNTGKVSATSNVEVRVPEILGSSTSPELTITKKANPTVTNPGKVVTYTVVVKNIGDGDAENVVVTDTLPKGFTFVDTGKSTKSWNLGTLEVNHERVLNYQVIVGTDVRAGKYVNVAVVTADGMSEEARATVEVKVPKVLGLATTGASARDYAFFILGLSLMALGGLWLARQRRSNSSIA